MTITTMT